jgi:hypothetical protein
MLVGQHIQNVTIYTQGNQMHEITEFNTNGKVAQLKGDLQLTFEQ